MMVYTTADRFEDYQRIEETVKNCLTFLRAGRSPDGFTDAAFAEAVMRVFDMSEETIREQFSDAFREREEELEREITETMREERKDREWFREYVS